MSTNTTLTSKENSNSNTPTELLEITPVPNTPLQVVGLAKNENTPQDKQYCVYIGQIRLTEPTTKEECFRMIQEHDYLLLMSLMNAVILFDKKAQYQQSANEENFSFHKTETEMSNYQTTEQVKQSILPENYTPTNGRQ